MNKQADPSAISRWFATQLPQQWFAGPAAVTLAEGGIQVVGGLPAVELPAGAEDGARAAAAAGRIARFREDTRPQRIEIAAAAQKKFGVLVTWGATCGDTSLLFTPGNREPASAGRAWGRRGDYVRV